MRATIAVGMVESVKAGMIRCQSTSRSASQLAPMIASRM